MDVGKSTKKENKTTHPGLSPELWVGGSSDTARALGAQTELS